MIKTSLIKTSKFICMILRHKPEAIGITLDEHGWANVTELIERVSKKYPLTEEILQEIVQNDDKTCYSFSNDNTLIRANQGHSIPVDVELPQIEPPEFLFHGTGEKYVAPIEQMGLIPKSRLYVHLSVDTLTSTKVGTRHGKPVIYRIAAKRMSDDGFTFYCSVNGVWLTKAVPIEYMEKLK
ncbi:MAG: RNA 2'-phosphotransferase [Oscillospiraceae bacterium]